MGPGESVFPAELENIESDPSPALMSFVFLNSHLLRAQHVKSASITHLNCKANGFTLELCYQAFQSIVLKTPEGNGRICPMRSSCHLRLLPITMWSLELNMCNVWILLKVKMKIIKLYF